MGAHNNLSGAQFEQLAQKMTEHGTDPETGGPTSAGFTVRPYPDEVGDIIRGKDAFMVGGAAPEGVLGNPPKGSEIASYVEENREALSSSPNMFLGGWNPGNAEVSPPVLDASTSFSRTLGGLMEAHTFAAQNNEIAVGELDVEGTYVNTMPTQKSALQGRVGVDLKRRRP